LSELSLLKKLIKENTSNPPGNEYRVAKIITHFFKKNNIKYKVFSKNKKRPNIVSYIGKGKPRLLIPAHMDVVPAGDGWKTNPFKATIKGDKVYGRGSTDNKGQLASILYAAKELKKYEKQLNGTVMIAAVSDEETSSKYGMKHLINKKLIKPDYAIIPDTGGYCIEIDIAEKGGLFFDIEFFGKQAHGSRPWTGINAIEQCAEFITKLKKHKFKYKKHKLLSPPTVNIGKIQGGAKHNIVAGKCKVGIDIRYLPGMTQKNILTEIKKLLKNYKYKIIILTNHKPTQVSPNNIIVKIIKHQVKKILKKQAKIIGLEGATVCKQLIEKGIPAIGYSSGDGNLAHSSNEHIKIKELKQFKRIIIGICLELMGVK